MSDPTIASLDVPSGPLPWYEIARRKYHERRYLSHFADDEVVQRAKDIFTNFTVLQTDCKIGPPATARERWYWDILWADVVEEFALRFGPYPSGFTPEFVKDLQIPRPDHPQARKAAASVASRTGFGPCLLKYGKRKYMQNAYERGEIRILPASRYDDPSLNRAIRDKETEVYIQPHPDALRMQVVDPVTLQPGPELKPVGSVLRAESTTDFHVYCLSCVLTPRLFLDFEADACLLIREPEIFVRRMLASVRATLEGFIGVGTPVHYLDPVHGGVDDLEPTLSKHFRYTYQKEYRIVWMPPVPAQALEPLHLSMGPLKDICELVALD